MKIMTFGDIQVTTDNANENWDILFNQIKRLVELGERLKPKGGKK